MRTAGEVRQHLLDTVEQIVSRPGMWASTGHEYQLTASMLLNTLCFVDDRDDASVAVRDALHRFGKLGVAAPFSTRFGADGRYVAEVASVFAEHFHALGYLPLPRLVEAEQWPWYSRKLRSLVSGRDVRRSELELALGSPSLVVNSTVLAYAPRDGSGWIFVDCHPQEDRRYHPTAGHFTGDEFADPLVRDVRLPTPGFEEGLLLTTYGKVLRWGPGWWIDHPDPAATEESRAIAAQLREIAADDPSHR